MRFPHYSVKEFLLGTSPSRKPSTKWFQFNEHEVDIQICHLCCTYLQFSDFERLVTRSGPQMPDITPRDILNTALTSDSKSLTAKAWLKVRKMQPDKRREGHALAFNDLAKLALKTPDGPFPLDMQFPLFAYANEYWSWHGSRLTPNSSFEWQSFETMFDSTNAIITHPLPDINWEGPSDLDLQTIAQRNHSALMQNALRRMEDLVLQNPAPLHRLLTLAIEHTSFEVLRTIRITGEPSGRSALSVVETNFRPLKTFELAMNGRQVCVIANTSYIATMSILLNTMASTIFIPTLTRSRDLRSDFFVRPISVGQLSGIMLRKYAARSRRRLGLLNVLVSSVKPPLMVSYRGCAKAQTTHSLPVGSFDKSHLRCLRRPLAM